MTFPTAGFITQNHLNYIAVTHYPKFQQLKTILHSSLILSVRREWPRDSLPRLLCYSTQDHRGATTQSTDSC